MGNGTIKSIANAQTIDWITIKSQYMADPNMGVETFLRKTLNRSEDQIKNGNRKIQTTWRQQEKKRLKEKAYEEWKKELEKTMIKEKTTLMQLAWEWYSINTKRIFIALKEDEDRIREIKEARERGDSEEEIKKLEKPELTLSDRVHLNRELRTIQGIPNNPTSPTAPPPELEDPSRALLDLLGDNEI